MKAVISHTCFIDSDYLHDNNNKNNNSSNSHTKNPYEIVRETKELWKHFPIINIVPKSETRIIFCSIYISVDAYHSPERVLKYFFFDKL